jgi:hypothetical protein
VRSLLPNEILFWFRSIAAVLFACTGLVVFKS